MDLTAPYQRVGADLVACGKFDDIVADELVGAHLYALAAADRSDRADGYQRELVDGALGAKLLKNTDHGICRRDDQEGHVLKRTDKRQRQTEDEKNQVEERQGVFLNDLTLRFCVRCGSTVAQARPLTLLDLLYRKPGIGVGVYNGDGRMFSFLCQRFLLHNKLPLTAPTVPRQDGGLKILLLRIIA